MADVIEIKGIREFQRSLRQMDSDAPKQIRVVLNSATQLILDYAQPRFPKLSGQAAGSLKARSSQREARIALGGRRAPYAPGLDFGGGRPQFPEYRPGGRYVYKGLEVRHDEITAAMSTGLVALARDAGLEVD